MAWLSGWSYRKEITITGQSGAGTNYQVDLDIGDSAGGDFHLEGQCTNFPQDIQITDNDGITPLDFWIEDITADPIKMWVEVADDLGSNQTIYIYYDKSGATTDSNGVDTYLLFEDAEAALSGWTAHAARGATAYEGDYGIYSSVSNFHPAHEVTENNICIDAKVKQSGRSGLHIRNTQSPEPYIGTGIGYQLFNKLDGNIYIYEEGVSYIATESATNPTTDWYNWKFAIDGGDMKGKYWADGTSEPAWMVEVTDATIASGGIGLYGYTVGTDYDLIRVRKYIATEPAFSSAGSEETPPTGWTGIIDGIINPASIIGIAVADIAKVNGI